MLVIENAVRLSTVLVNYWTDVHVLQNSQVCHRFFLIEKATGTCILYMYTIIRTYELSEHTYMYPMVLYLILNFLLSIFK